MTPGGPSDPAVGAPVADDRRIRANVLWNFGGLTLPILVALVTIPVLIDRLGDDRFGILSLAWLVFSYFSIFDLGLNRALTRMAARALGAERPFDLPALFWTALALMLVAGLIGGGIVGFGTKILVDGLLNVPEALRHEVSAAFQLIAVSLPLLVSTIALRGFVEAHQRFRPIFFVQLWHGSWTFVGPLLVALWTPHLGWVVAALLAGRIVTWAAYAALCFRVAPQLRHRPVLEKGLVREFLTYGGWITLTHSVVPLILYGDRIVISIIVSAAALTYYVAPAEIVIKLLIIPTALCGVFFPAIAAASRHDPARVEQLVRSALRLLFAGFLPVALVAVAIGPEALSLWLDPDFAASSGLVLQLLVIGTFLNGLGAVPVALLQASGRPDLVAKLYIAELLPTALTMWALVTLAGIEGAALAWLLRAGLDLGALVLLARRCLRPGALPLGPPALVTMAALGAFAALTAIDGATPRLLLLGATMTTSIALCWRYLLTPEDRDFCAALVGLGGVRRDTPARERYDKEPAV